MGIVIPLPATRQSKPKARASQGCHVVIFPGVRIEREGNRRVGILRRPKSGDGRKPTKSA